MSLKHFHLFFIATALSLMAFLLYWVRQQGLAGAWHPGLGLCAGATFALGLAYLMWFLRKYKKLA